MKPQLLDECGYCGKRSRRRTSHAHSAAANTIMPSRGFLSPGKSRARLPPTESTWMVTRPWRNLSPECEGGDQATKESDAPARHSLGSPMQSLSPPPLLKRSYGETTTGR